MYVPSLTLYTARTSYSKCFIISFYRARYASAVLGVVILSVCPSVRVSHACFVTNPKNLTAIFFIPHERAILLVKCDFSYSCAAADKISKWTCHTWKFTFESDFRNCTVRREPCLIFKAVCMYTVSQKTSHLWFAIIFAYTVQLQ